MSAARQNHNVPGDTSGIQTINNEIQIIELCKRSALVEINLSLVHFNSAKRKADIEISA